MDATERRDRATDEAAQWWARLGTRPPADVPAADREQFTAWLRESPLHVAEMLQVAHVHDTLKRFAYWSEVAADPGPQDANVVALTIGDGIRGESRRARMRPRAWAAAAVLVCIAVAAGWFALGRNGQSIETARADRREVMLNDGSVVRLEPETTITVILGDRERRVRLSRGRALFHVAKDARRPFLVEVEGTVVRAVGTAFGVERNESGVVVTVSEGKVAVTPVREVGHGGSETPNVVRPLFLTAGKQVTVAKAGAKRVVTEVDTERALAWAEGRLVFDSAPLREVAEEFNRYNHVQLHIDDADLARRTVSGIFKASDPETFIAFIGAGARVNVVRAGQEDIFISSLAVAD